MKNLLIVFVMLVCSQFAIPCSNDIWAGGSEPNTIKIDHVFYDEGNEYLINTYFVERWDCGKWKGYSSGTVCVFITDPANVYVPDANSYYVEISPLTMPNTHCFSGVLEPNIHQKNECSGDDTYIKTSLALDVWDAPTDYDGCTHNDPADCKVSVWVDGIISPDHSSGHPAPPQGFFHGSQWGTPDGQEYSWWDTYRHDGTRERDPNFVAHGIEIIPYREEPLRQARVYICAARKGSDGEVDITGPYCQASWNGDTLEPRPHERWTHGRSVWGNRIFGGESQRCICSEPFEMQCYKLGTIYTYIDVTFADFAECWLYDFPPFDFNKDGIVDMQDFVIFSQEFLNWKAPK